MQSSIVLSVKSFIFSRDGLIIIFLSLILLLLISSIFRAPYNIRYTFNRFFYTPTFVCRDDIYSFASTPSGACSSHGGINNEFRDNPYHYLNTKKRGIFQYLTLINQI